MQHIRAQTRRHKGFTRARILACLMAVLPAFGLGAEESVPVDTPQLEHVMTVRATVDAMMSMGKTPQGERRVVPINGGTFEGPGLKGTILPGGEDWQLIREDGVMELDARYWLRTDDGAVIRVHNQVLSASAPAGEGKKRYARSSVRFEAPLGKYEWLNKAVYVGTITAHQTLRPPVIELRFYRVN